MSTLRLLAASAVCAIGLALAPAQATAAELIVNGTFDTDISGWSVVDIDSSGNCSWTQYSAPLAGTTGGYAGVLSGAQRCGFYQDVTIPAGNVSTLSAYTGSIDNAGNVADIGALQIRNTSNGLIETLYSHNGGAGNNTPVAMRGPYNLDAYAGQTIRIFFLTENVNDVYQMRVDTVVLKLQPAGPLAGADLVGMGDDPVRDHPRRRCGPVHPAAAGAGPDRVTWESSPV